MFKKIIAFIMLASVLASAFAVASFGAFYYGNEVEVAGSLKVKIIYAGLGVAPYTNTNIETSVASNGASMFQPSVNTDTAFNNFAWRPIFAYTSAPSSNAFSVDFVLDFDNYNATQYKALLTFSSPMTYDDNYNNSTREGGTFWLEKCYWEAYRSRTYNYLSDSYSHKTSAPVGIDTPSAKIHVHLEGTKTNSGNWSSYHALYVLMTVNSFTVLNDTTTLAEYEREQAENESQDIEEQSQDAQEDVQSALTSTVNAFGTIGSAMSTNSTTVSNWQLPAMYIPATTVTPRVELSSAKDIDFQSWINSIPSQWMTLIRIICSCAIFVFCGKEVISIISILLNNRDSIDGLTNDLSSQKKDEGN